MHWERQRKLSAARAGGHRESELQFRDFGESDGHRRLIHSGSQLIRGSASSKENKEVGGFCGVWEQRQETGEFLRAAETQGGGCRLCAGPAPLASRTATGAAGQQTCDCSPTRTTGPLKMKSLTGAATGQVTPPKGMPRDCRPSGVPHHTFTLGGTDC